MGGQKKLMRDLLFSSTNIVAMTSRENLLLGTDFKFLSAAKPGNFSDPKSGFAVKGTHPFTYKSDRTDRENSVLVKFTQNLISRFSVMITGSNYFRLRTETSSTWSNFNGTNYNN